MPEDVWDNPTILFLTCIVRWDKFKQYQSGTQWDQWRPELSQVRPSAQTSDTVWILSSVLLHFICILQIHSWLLQFQILGPVTTVYTLD